MATVDLEQLRGMTGGDAELAAEALGIFRAQADLWGRLLDAQAEPRQWTDACHTIKGAANSVGAFPLGSACSDAEALGRTPNPAPAQIGVALATVKDRLGEAIEAVAAIEHQLMLQRSFDRLRAG